MMKKKLFKQKFHTIKKIKPTEDSRLIWGEKL